MKRPVLPDVLRRRAELAVVLGSGLSPAPGEIDILESVSYEHAGLPAPGVDGHDGRLLLARCGGRPVLFFSGRPHRYEGGDPAAAERIVEAAATAGCRRVLLTQAAGSLVVGLPPGAWLLASGVVSFPARGLAPGDRRTAPLISSAMRGDVAAAAAAAGVPLREGVLCWMTGPAYETPAEARAAAAIGGEAATMSALPELLAARRIGLRAACLARITNYTANVSASTTDHDEVLQAGRNATGELLSVVVRLAAR